MLGPVAGGLLIKYFALERDLFPQRAGIGLLGLFLVYRYLPDYRARESRPLDVTGLILFGSGIALLSYVLEVFGEHFLSSREIGGLLAISLLLLAGYAINARRTQYPLLRMSLVPHPHVFRRGGRQLRHAPGRRRNSRFCCRCWIRSAWA